MFVRSALKPKKQEHKFIDDLITLLNNITLHCYRQLVQLDRSVWERFMWIIIHMVGASFLGVIIYRAWEDFTISPLVTTLHDTLYPSSEVPFPAVAICNNNRISKRAAIKYAEYLNEQDSDDSKNVSYYLDRIQLLGNLYNYDVDNNAMAMRVFQEFLDLHDSDNGTGYYKIVERMTQLTPKCENIMVRCFWETVEIPCMRKNDMMERRKTSYGTCCTFNYVSHLGENEVEVEPYYSHYTGPVMGLMVVVNGSSNDYFHSIFNSVGFIVQIFNPHDFPELTNGGIVEKFVQLETEAFIRIDATTLWSEPSVQHYSLEKRQCLFRHELSNKFGGSYSRSNCLMNCRVNSIIALCGCRPFHLPLPNHSMEPSTPICTLQHIECLNKYQIKWYTVVTKIHKIIGLEKEMEESLYCPECLSSCSNNKYQVSITDLPLIESRRVSYSLATGLKNITDMSIIRVFFGQPETWLYKQDVSNQWFEIFSNFGGMFGIMAGFSLISFTEIVYFLLKQIILIWLNRSHSTNNKHFIGKSLQIYP